MSQVIEAAQPQSVPAAAQEQASLCDVYLLIAVIN